MKIQALARNEDGSIIFEGELNKQEVSFLLHYSINDLLAAGVQFNLDEPDDDSEDIMRIKFPEGTLN